MFNLLMQYLPWDGSRGTVPLSRVFEYTDDSLSARLKTGTLPDFPTLLLYPALFMREGIDDEMARVGTVNRARIAGNEISIEYSFDPDVPPLMNSNIFAHRSEFDMHREFEFSRTHWAVKDVDLYRMLLRLVRPRRQRPTVFSIPEHEHIESAMVSVMMPFDAAFAEVYNSIQRAASLAGLRCRRADDMWEAPAIIQDIVSLIDRSRVVVCDCTGRNPNVFYEIGIAHTLGREVVLLAQSASDIPFDLRHLRHLQYLNNAEGRKALELGLSAKLSAMSVAT